MQEILIRKLHSYLQRNNPDILIELQSEQKVTAYLVGKVSSIDSLLDQLLIEGRPPMIVEEICLDALTEDLRPSRYSFIESILEEEFTQTHRRFQEASILTFEVLNMVATCKPIFDRIQYTEEMEDNRQLRHVVIGMIAEYLENNK